MSKVMYGVFHNDTLISHKIHSNIETYFPALFESLKDAKDYARGIGSVRKVSIRVNKKILNKGEYYE